MTGLSSTTQKAFSSSDIKFWHKSFSDLSAESVEAGFTRFVLTGDDWPSISKIRRLALESQSGRHLMAGEAFERVSAAVRRFGQGRRLEAFATFDEATRRAVEQSGGWNWFCELSSENRTTISAQFERRYNAVVERVVETRCLPGPLRPNRIEGATDEAKRLSETLALPKE